MKHYLPPLDGLKAFESAARHLSFSLAADELCITKGAVSYQIRKLEEHLQYDLFKRSVRQVYLTDGGQMLLQTTQSLFSDLSETLNRLQENNRQTGITIAVTTYVAARWLSRHISAFNEHYPQVNVLLQHSVNAADFKLTDVDIAIRWGPCHTRPEPNQFGEIPMALYPVASPQLLERYSIDAGATRNARHLAEPPFTRIPLLCEDRQLDMWQAWFGEAAAEADQVKTRPTDLVNKSEQATCALSNPRRVISDANVRVQAAIDGQGLILADDMMINELNSGLLVCPFAESLHGYGYTFLSSASRVQNPQTQSLIEWLSKQVTATEHTP